MKRTPVAEAGVGDIVAMAGFKDINIGETVADAANPEALPSIHIDEPTLSMVFHVNKSPFAGREGDFVTSRHIRARLMKEIETNVALRVEETETSDAFLVSGRGELHLSVLIETMRREGFELEVSKPQVIYKTINGKRCEPLERLTVEVPQEFMGAVMEGLGPRRAEMISMEELAGYMKMDFPFLPADFWDSEMNFSPPPAAQASCTMYSRDMRRIKGIFPKEREARLSLSKRARPPLMA